MALPVATSLREKALATLRDVLRPEEGRPYALLDFPCGTNVGDSAIWLGTRAALEAIGMGPPAYTCDDRTFEPEVLRRRVPDGPILLLGGGNFGDLFAKHQRLREDVVAAFPDRRVVQLPQSIHYAQPEAREVARRALSGHRRLTVLVRDGDSLETATKHLGLEAALCPDLAVLLDPVAPRPQRERRILWLTRLDAWRIKRNEPPDSFASHDAVVSDWPSEQGSLRRHRIRLLSSWIRRGRLRSLPLNRWLSDAYDPLARRRVERAVAWMSSASVVVTDRLHGHVLAMLLGMPHVLMDDATRKVRGYHDLWLRGAPGIIWAEDAVEATSLARRMLDGSANAAAGRA